LEAHQPTERFIKPLNLLAGYYEHQLENLKGFRKISSKQQENLEAIDAWIKDVKALVETLERCP
jgi:archaellum component FlaC